MTLHFPAGKARVARRFFHEAILPLIAGSLTLASAGCFHSAAKPIPPTQQQMEAYAKEQTALRHDVSRPREDLQEHCDQLAVATPGVEELRINQGSVESRQWTLVSDGSAPRWMFLRGKDSSVDGWAPKPGLDKLNFQPPLEPALNPGTAHFLAYAPLDGANVDEGRKSATAREVFGAPQGNFTWRGRRYSYTVTPELPCFPRLQ